MIVSLKKDCCISGGIFKWNEVNMKELLLAIVITGLWQVKIPK
ncbi:MAG: hypothetical protein ACI9UT_000531 [Flavobacteriales bacterium]|jgi:hypothetical protein